MTSEKPTRTAAEITPRAATQRREVAVPGSREVSEVDLLRSHPQGAIELAAATLSRKFDRLLSAAIYARRDITQSDLAGRLSVTPGRVSQVLSGEENLRVSTMGRYLRALGYEVELKLTSVEPSAPSIEDRVGRGIRRDILTSRIYVSIVTDGESIAPKFSIIPETMSEEHSEVEPPILLGRLAEHGMRNMTLHPVIVAGNSKTTIWASQ